MLAQVEAESHADRAATVAVLMARWMDVADHELSTRGDDGRLPAADHQPGARGDPATEAAGGPHAPGPCLCQSPPDRHKPGPLPGCGSWHRSVSISWLQGFVDTPLPASLLGDAFRRATYAVARHASLPTGRPARGGRRRPRRTHHEQHRPHRNHVRRGSKPLITVFACPDVSNLAEDAWSSRRPMSPCLGRDRRHGHEHPTRCERPSIDLAPRRFRRPVWTMRPDRFAPRPRNRLAVIMRFRSSEVGRVGLEPTTDG